jgi:hypothetical protein
VTSELMIPTSIPLNGTRRVRSALVFTWQAYQRFALVAFDGPWGGLMVGVVTARRSPDRARTDWDESEPRGLSRGSYLPVMVFAEVSGV